MSLQSSVTDPLVKVFARKVDKKAKSLKLSPKIQGKELKIIISNKLNIPFEDLSLYARGQEIQEEIQLSPKTIIHAIDLRNVKCDHISIHVKTLEKGASRHTFEVKTNLQIGEFIKESLQQVFHEKAEDLFLVYVGKQLNQKMSFIEENVQNLAEIVCIKCQQFRNDKKTVINQKVTSQGKQKVYIQQENVVRDGQHQCGINTQEEPKRVEEEKKEEPKDSGSKYAEVAHVNRVTQVQSDRADNVYEIAGGSPVENVEKAFFKTAEFGEIVKVEEKSYQQINKESKQNEQQSRQNQYKNEETPVQFEPVPKQIVESALEKVESAPNNLQASYEQLVEIIQNVENKCGEVHQNEEIADNKPFEEAIKNEEAKQEEEKVSHQIEEIPEDNPLQERIPEEKPQSLLDSKKQEIQQVPEDNPLKDQQDDINKDNGASKQEQMQKDQEEREINEQKGRDKEEAKKQEEIPKEEPLSEEVPDNVLSKEEVPEQKYEQVVQIPEDKQMHKGEEEQNIQIYAQNKQQDIRTVALNTPKETEENPFDPIENVQNIDGQVKETEEISVKRPEDIEQIPEDNPLQEEQIKKADSNDQQLHHVAQSAVKTALINQRADFQENNRKLEIIAQLPQVAKSPVPPNGLSYEEVKVANSYKNSSSLVIYQQQVTIKTNSRQVAVVHSSGGNVAIPVEQQCRASKHRESIHQKKDEVNGQSYE